MRIINVSEITKAVRDMCIEANHYLSDDMKERLSEAREEEKSPLGRQIIGQLQENLQIAGDEMIPICQDTGMAVVFLKVGQDVHLEGGSLKDAVNQGIHDGYVDGFLRKSVVGDPIERVNTKDNTPAVIHYEITEGDQVDITFAPKGAGSENMSRIFMLKPADGIEGVKNAILTAVKDAGPNACPPMVVGVGIGGNFEKCAIMSKHALTRNLREESQIPYVRDLEKEMLQTINKLGIGPGGLGGTVTALAVNIETYPTHIACLPVAVNICCHVNRHAHRVI
jgi:fumarate hydratase subunit alpha